MNFLKRKKRKRRPSLQDIPEQEAEPVPHEDSPPSGEVDTALQDNSLDLIDEMLDPKLIGRVIKLVKADNWEEDLIETSPKETQILYENQRG